MIFTFKQTLDRILADHWYEVINNLKVLPNFQLAKEHVLKLIRVMQDEQVIVNYFTTFPRRKFDSRDQRKLLELSYLTPDIILNKIKEERIRRLCIAYKSLQTYKFQKPWIM